MVVRRAVIIPACFLLLLLPRQTRAQANQTSTGHLHTFISRGNNISFDYQGTLVKRGESEFLISLRGSENAEDNGGRVHIFVSQRPFVYLPGTYGGRYYFDADKHPGVFSDCTHGDSLAVNGLKFALDYWAVYAGMGQWETVENCYAFHDGEYYTLALIRDFHTAMPGAKVNGVAESKRQMRAGLITKMRDTSDASVKSFNQIVKTFSITK